MKNKIISISLFLFVFTFLLIIGTFYDYQISELLASSFLIDGNYYSTNIFARFFKVIGETPLFFFLNIAFTIILVIFYEKRSSKLMIFLAMLFFIFGCISAFVCYQRMIKYLYYLHPSTFSYLYHSFIGKFLLLILALLTQLLFTVIALKKCKKTCLKLLPFALLIIFTALFSQSIVQSIKPLFARERFRAIYYLNYHNVESQGFSKWYVMHFNAKEIVASFPEYLNVTTSFFSSFPSGHTCSAGTAYAVIILPYCLPFKSAKKAKIILLTFAIALTGIIGFSRIVMGAHYLTDVLFGGTIPFVFAILGLKIYQRYINKKLAIN
ncbi:MAG: phosphatase PAP2 family protein [Erysipelotrichaceae bacterium]|nr:phosphatase PAP2 family protein [Erysipelotrichaceae bacterium]